MTREEFIGKYTEFAKVALVWAEKSRREGLLALDDELDREKAYGNRDIFEYGMRFVVDGVSQDIIRGILSNIIEQEKDEYTRLFMTIQRAAVLTIQDGVNPHLIFLIMNSFTDLSLRDDPVGKEVLDD